MSQKIIRWHVKKFQYVFRSVSHKQNVLIKCMNAGLHFSQSSVIINILILKLNNMLIPAMTVQIHIVVMYKMSAYENTGSDYTHSESEKNCIIVLLLYFQNNFQQLWQYLNTSCSTPLQNICMYSAILIFHNVSTAILSIHTSAF